MNAKIESPIPHIENEKDLEKMIAQQITTRLEELGEHNEKELKELVLFLENRMAIMMVELELSSMLDMRKEELLQSEDITEEELEKRFEELQDEVDAQMDGSGAFLEMFDKIFRAKASPKMVELLLDDDNDE
jgi:hypothetical protein